MGFVAGGTLLTLHPLMSAPRLRGLQLPRFFPAINVGFVYCRNSTSGAAHRVLREVAKRFELFLDGEIVPLPNDGSLRKQQQVKPANQASQSYSRSPSLTTAACCRGR